MSIDQRGFEILERVLDPAECARLAAGIAPCCGAGARHLMTDAGVRAFAYHEALLAIARAAVGPTAMPFRATLFAKSGVRNWLVVWHQDTTLPLATRHESPEWGPWSVKAGVVYAHAPAWALANVVALRVHLDDCTAANGPLRVIPGSHRQGVLADALVFRLARERAAVECLVGCGGVLAMRPLLIHASSKAHRPEPRRVLHLEYAASLDLGPGLRLAVA
ncbi:MAG: phytanoyl-CoA dioxygenase family protein [Planctomycetota bacterium]